MGMVHTELTTKRGAKKNAKVYNVEGFNAEALLGYAMMQRSWVSSPYVKRDVLQKRVRLTTAQ